MGVDQGRPQSRVLLQVQLFLKKVRNYQSLNVLHSLKVHVTGYRCITFLEGWGRPNWNCPARGFMNRRRPGEGSKNEFRVEQRRGLSALNVNERTLNCRCFQRNLREGCRDDLDNTAFSNRYSSTEVKQYNFLDKADQNHRDACQRPSPLEVREPRQRIFLPLAHP